MVSKGARDPRASLISLALLHTQYNCKMGWLYTLSNLPRRTHATSIPYLCPPFLNVKCQHQFSLACALLPSCPDSRFPFLLTFSGSELDHADVDLYRPHTSPHLGFCFGLLIPFNSFSIPNVCATWTSSMEKRF